MHLIRNLSFKQLPSLFSGNFCLKIKQSSVTEGNLFLKIEIVDPIPRKKTYMPCSLAGYV